MGDRYSRGYHSYTPLLHGLHPPTPSLPPSPSPWQQLTRIKAEVAGLLFDGHGTEGRLRGALRWPRGAHGGDSSLGVPRIHQLLLEALGGHGDQGLRHLAVVRGPAIAGHSVAGGRGGLRQELGAGLAL